MPRKEVHRSLPQAVLKIAMSAVEARRSSSSRRHPPKSHAAITSEWNVVHRSPPFQTSPDLRLAGQPCTPLPTLEKPSHRVPLLYETQTPTLFPHETQALPPPRFSAATKIAVTVASREREIGR
ncbi:hypothetical protein TIFTF001_002766 [Ficus carica]|uniref:Uncharacterized protein n=1 Tax=Ficus carica TaxID=3494 RepID=A0AA88CU54_FICCA|nr:hypothetical protein TIFTF001_002766 [Ficus carica]